MVGFVVCRVKSIRFCFHIIEPPDVGQGFKRQLLILHLGLEEPAPCVGPAAQELLPFHPLEVFVHDVTVALDGSGEVLQQTHGHAGAPGAMFIEEEPVSRHHVHHTPYISLHRAVLFIVYYRQCALVHLNIVAGDVAAGVLDHRLFPEWCPQDGATQRVLSSGHPPVSAPPDASFRGQGVCYRSQVRPARGAAASSCCWKRLRTRRHPRCTGSDACRCSLSRSAC